MIARKRKHYDPTRCSLKKLCKLVISYSYPYEDLAELIEDKGYEECVEGRCKEVVEELELLSAFFESMENKNEENTRDLADVYLLIGEFFQCSDMFSDSISWFEKAVVVDDAYDVPYHSLSMTYLNLGETEKAVKSLEQEIKISPGNYYTYLLLADLYQKQEKYEDVERILRSLLSRDSNNIQALHKLITYYIKRNPQLDIELLRRRLINVDKQLVKLDLIIWTFHMCEEGKYEETLRFLSEREHESPGISIIHLLKAHIYGCMLQYVKKGNELKEFRKLNCGREEFMRTKFDEFSKVFGEKASVRLQKKLAVTKLTSRYTPIRTT